ncbi:MAG: threonine/serine dehydratase [Nitratireductor sp.]
MSESNVPNLEQITRAFDFTRGATIETPLLEVEALATLSGASRVFVKPESLQRTGSFKFRGAYWRVNQLTPAEKKRGVVAYSSGNFAQGLAAAARIADIPCTIVMPFDAPQAKREGAESFGARIVLSEHGDKPREEVASAMARQISQEEGLTLLHPFDDSSIVAGQAGAGLEALEQFDRLGLPYPDTVFCCVGGGGLVGGVSLAFHYRSSSTKVIAVEPDGYDGMGQSLDASTITRAISSNPTICDALQATAPGSAPFAAVTKAGIGHVSVSDGAVRRAMRMAFETMKLVLEPSGAIAIAALLESGRQFESKTVLCYATGGNITFENFSNLLAA